jgi:hypothetical protein
MNTYRLTDLDRALDFAYANRRGIKFCEKMVRVFEVYGNLTPAQVKALLEISAKRR